MLSQPPTDGVLEVDESSQVQQETYLLGLFAMCSVVISTQCTFGRVVPDLSDGGPGPNQDGGRTMDLWDRLSH